MRHLSTRIVISLLLGCLLPLGSGCGGSSGQQPDAGLDATDGGQPDGGDETQPPFPLPDAFLSQVVLWENCDLIAGSGDGRAECADVWVPPFWDAPDFQTAPLSLRIKRLLASGGQGTAQLWYLHGGPGGAGVTGLAPMMDFVQQFAPAVDMYVLDHRGVGQSDRMGCPAEEDDDSPGGFGITDDELEDCAAWIQAEWRGVEPFTTTQAAVDLAGLIALTREPDKRVFVLGISYGAYWGHRYLQLFPHQSDGVILDSVPPPDYPFPDYDLNGNRTVDDYLDLCAQDPLCSEKLGPDPHAKAMEILDRFRDGHCPMLPQIFGVTPDGLRQALYTACMMWDYRILLPTLFYRLDRCEPRDARSILYAYSALTKGQEDRQYSSALGFTVIHSEMLPGPVPSSEEVAALMAGELLEYGVSQGVADREGRWPTYPRDEWVGAWAGTDMPVLMLNGTLDMQTAIWQARTIIDHLDGPAQHFVEIPGGNHGVVTASPVLTPGAAPCGLQIIQSFMADPLAGPDLACLDDLAPIRFDNNPFIAENLMLSTDLWDDLPIAMGCDPGADMLEAPGGDHLLVQYRGPLTDPQNAGQPGMVRNAAVLDGQAVDLDSYMGYAYQFSPDGQDYLMHQSLGGFELVGPSEIQMWMLRVQMPRQVLLDMQASGQTRVALGDHEHLLAVIERIEDKRTLAGRYLRYCPRAITDSSSPDAEFALCTEDGQVPSPGQTLQVTLRAPLLSDPALLGACRCNKNQTEVIDCADFDQIRSARAARPFPGYALPPIRLPAHLPSAPPSGL